MNKIYFRNNSNITGRLKEEMVMMDIRKGKYFALNPVATRIWDILEQPKSRDQICEILMAEYEVDDETCQLETGNLLEEMMKLGVVTQGDKSE